MTEYDGSRGPGQVERWRHQTLTTEQMTGRGFIVHNYIIVKSMRLGSDALWSFKRKDSSFTITEEAPTMAFS